jgi:hypothetical protein
MDACGSRARGFQNHGRSSVEVRSCSHCPQPCAELAVFLAGNESDSQGTLNPKVQGSTPCASTIDGGVEFKSTPYLGLLTRCVMPNRCLTA